MTATRALAFERARIPGVTAMNTTIDTTTWVITGATSGLGPALAAAALQAGERVVGTARRVDRFDSLKSRYGDQLLALEHDVRDTSSAANVVQNGIDAFGRIDVLVNNAGTGQVGAAEEVTDRELRDMLEQHLLHRQIMLEQRARIRRQLRELALALGTTEYKIRTYDGHPEG